MPSRKIATTIWMRWRRSWRRSPLDWIWPSMLLAHERFPSPFSSPCRASFGARSRRPHGGPNVGLCIRQSHRLPLTTSYFRDRVAPMLRPSPYCVHIPLPNEVQMMLESDANVVPMPRQAEAAAAATKPKRSRAKALTQVDRRFRLGRRIAELSAIFCAALGREALAHEADQDRRRRQVKGDRRAGARPLDARWRRLARRCGPARAQGRTGHPRARHWRRRAPGDGAQPQSARRSFGRAGRRQGRPMSADFTVLDGLDDALLFAPHFRGDSWAGWRAVLAALFGLPMRGQGGDVSGLCGPRIASWAAFHGGGRRRRPAGRQEPRPGVDRRLSGGVQGLFGPFGTRRACDGRDPRRQQVAGAIDIQVRRRPVARRPAARAAGQESDR